jgi:hypothetical protein
MHEPLAQLLERTYSAAEREVIYRLIRGCGRVQHFAADPIPMETAACAEGLGVEWIRLLDAGAVARLLALPPRVQLIAYLCLGIPQAFDVRPRREAVDWRARRRLDSRIYTDLWGQTGVRLAAAMPPADDHAPRG